MYVMYLLALIFDHTLNTTLYQLYIQNDPMSFLCLLLLMPLLQTNSINETKSILDYIVCANGIRVDINNWN